MKLWSAWVRLWDAREAPHMLALLRVLIGVVLIWDLLEAAQLGLVQTLWAPSEAGGLRAMALAAKNQPLLFQLMEPTPELGLWLWGLTLGAAVLWTLGVLTPVSGTVLLLSWAQLNMALPRGDRGIDMMLRNCTMILIFSQCGRAWSVDAWLRFKRWRGADSVPAWPRHLIILQLLVMYFWAGIQKSALTWTPLGGYSALFVILHDPHIARFEMAELLRRLTWMSRLGTFATKMFEISAPLVLVLYWLRWTHERGGRLREWASRLRLRSAYVALGAILHVGIAVTMDLGIFPWAMLALYPAWFHPDELTGLIGRFWRTKTA
jgi:hypothetical protein